MKNLVNVVKENKKALLAGAAIVGGTILSVMLSSKGEHIVEGVNLTNDAINAMDDIVTDTDYEVLSDEETNED